MVNSIFVYGTLQRGHERAPMWPRPPRQVECATIRGRLHDLGIYPALVDGEELIGGELWQLRPEDMQVTLETLDRIECYGLDDVDLYVRRIVQCETADGKGVPAYAYFFADPDQLANVPIVAPGPDGVCAWVPQKQQVSGPSIRARGTAGPSAQ